MSDYVSRVSADLQQRYAGQPEYLQAVLTWLEMIAPALEDNPIYERVDLLTRMVEPDRMLTFTVPWMDDQGMAHTNHGYRVQFNVAGATTTYDVLDLTAGTTLVSGAAYGSGQAIAFDGVQLAVTGAPADNDTFDVSPSAALARRSTSADRSFMSRPML